MPLGFLYLVNVYYFNVCSLILIDRNGATNCVSSLISQWCYSFDINLSALSKAHVHDAAFHGAYTQKAATGATLSPP